MIMGIQAGLREIEKSITYKRKIYSNYTRDNVYELKK